MKLKVFGLFLFLFFFNAASASDEIFPLQKGAPLFQDPEKMNLAYTVEKEMAAIVLKKRESDMIFQDYLVLRTSLWKVFVSNMGEFWTFPDIESVYKKDLKEYSFRFARIPPLLFSGALLLFAGALSALFFFWNKTFRFRNCLLPLSIVCLQCGICLYAIGYSGGVFIKPTDEIWYFKIGRQLLSFDFSAPFRYTIGHPLFFYAPLVFFTGAVKYEEAGLWAMILNCFFIMPVCLLLVFGVLKKLFRSATLPFYSLLLWFGFVLLYHPRLFTGQLNIAETYVQKAVAALPVFGLNLSLYDLYVVFGWHGISDPLCMLFLFLSLLAGILLKPSVRNLIIVSALFAATCLIRINSILYVPLFGFILYLNYAELLKIPGNRRRLILYGSLAFLAVFSLQLAVNFYQFGSPFTWPYVLHTDNDSVHGFMPGLVPYGLYFLSASNHAIFVLGTLSLFFIPDRKMRALLALWIYPVVFFFTGYPVVYNNYSRFILPVYPAFMAAIFLNGVWKERLSVVLRSLGILLAGVLLTAPGDAPAVRRYLPWSLEWHGVSPETMDMVRWIVIALSIVVLATFMKDILRARKEGQPLREILSIPFFLGLFLIVFYAGNYWITGAAMLCAFLYGLYDAVLLCLEARPEDRAFP
ncbi:MAG: hypothetical protein BWY31_03111 [Lentisphaerae bacterium ADurb.Bin242]|nr:MAG: hypothetical protein BWY31_03111 [Lentisphaerae bacterium ADurb.Bin242]